MRRFEKDAEKFAISFTITREELDQIDFAWRSNMKFSSRTAYILYKLGIGDM